MGTPTTESSGGGKKCKAHARQSRKNQARRKARRDRLVSEKNKILRNLRTYRHQPNNAQAFAAAKRVLNDHPLLKPWVSKLPGVEVVVNGETYSLRLS